MDDKTLQDLTDELLHGYDVTVRRNAAINLCKLKDNKAIPALMQGLNDHEDVSIFCVLAIVEIGNDSIEYLREGLLSKNEKIRGYSAEILGEINAEDALEDLFRVIRNDESVWVKNTAVESIVRFHNPKITGFLKDLLTSEDVWLVVSASIALQKLGFQPENVFHMLLDKLLTVNPKDQSIVVWGLVEIGKKENIQQLAKLVEENQQNPALQRLYEEIIRGIKNK